MLLTPGGIDEDTYFNSLVNFYSEKYRTIPKVIVENTVDWIIAHLQVVYEESTPEAWGLIVAYALDGTMHTVTPDKLDSFHRKIGPHDAQDDFDGLFLGVSSPEIIVPAIASQMYLQSKLEKLSGVDKKAYQRLIQEAIARCCKEFGEANKPGSQATSLEEDKENAPTLSQSTDSQKTSKTQQKQPLQEKTNQQTALLRYKPLSFSNSTYPSIQPLKTTIPAPQATPGGSKTISPNNGGGHK